MPLMHSEDYKHGELMIELTNKMLNDHPDTESKKSLIDLILYTTERTK
jgi:hypothetical protein